MPYPNTKNFGGFRADVIGQEDWYKVCLRVKDTKLPKEDLPPKQVTGKLKDCDAQDLYYRSEKDSDWVTVKYCAIKTQNEMILMMLYANGRGTSRNYELAQKFACGLGGAYAEVSGRVMHLEYLNQGRTPDQTPVNRDRIFDVCDDITSGYMAGFCTAIQESKDKRVREQRLNKLTKGWLASQLSALHKLRRALKTFAAERGNSETDLMGTMRASFAIQAQAQEEQEFVEDLENIERGHLPNYSKADYVKLDKELNDFYQMIQRNPNYEDMVIRGTITREGIKKTQRTWLAYRDAWVTMGKVRYPSVDPDSWRAFLTAKRVTQLSGLAFD